MFFITPWSCKSRGEFLFTTNKQVMSKQSYASLQVQVTKLKADLKYAREYYRGLVIENKDFRREITRLSTELNKLRSIAKELVNKDRHETANKS